MAWHGEIRIYRQTDPKRHRDFTVAELHEIGQVLPIYDNHKLYDSQLIAMDKRGFTLTGVERVGEIEFGQSWLCVVAE